MISLLSIADRPATTPYERLVSSLADSLTGFEHELEWHDLRSLTDAEVAIVARHDPLIWQIGMAATGLAEDDERLAATLDSNKCTIDRYATFGAICAGQVAVNALKSITPDVQQELDYRAEKGDWRQQMADEVGIPMVGEI